VTKCWNVRLSGIRLYFDVVMSPDGVNAVLIIQ
jgi:hypothetical protein